MSRSLRDTLAAKADEFVDVVMVGRTHLQDATPVTLGQVIGGWVAQLDFALDGIRHADSRARELAIGGTAVGTGLNAHPDFGTLAAEKITRARPGSSSSRPTTCSRRCRAHDALVEVSRARCGCWPTR